MKIDNLQACQLCLLFIPPRCGFYRIFYSIYITGLHPVLLILPFQGYIIVDFNANYEVPAKVASPCEALRGTKQSNLHHEVLANEASPCEARSKAISTMMITKSKYNLNCDDEDRFTLLAMTLRIEISASSPSSF